MFNSHELSLFESSYFSNFSYSTGIIEIQSKNAGHCWRKLKKDMPRSTMVVIYHKYKFRDNYHVQCHVHTFNKALRLIRDNDSYILNQIFY